MKSESTVDSAFIARGFAPLTVVSSALYGWFMPGPRVRAFFCLQHPPPRPSAGPGWSRFYDVALSLAAIAAIRLHHALQKEPSSRPCRPADSR